MFLINQKKIITNQWEKANFIVTIISNIKVTVKEIKRYQSKKYLDQIKPHLKVILNNSRKSDTWKIQLAIAINFLKIV